MRTHGTISCYQSGCRCVDCKRTGRLQRARYRRRTGQRQIVPVMCPFCGDWFARLGLHEPHCLKVTR